MGGGGVNKNTYAKRLDAARAAREYAIKQYTLGLCDNSARAHGLR